MERVRYPVRAAERILRILVSFTGDQPRRGYQEVARETGIPASTTFKLMKLLAEQGFLEEVESNRLYRIGLESYRIGRLYLVDRPLVEVARPWLRKLAEELGITSSLAVRDRDRVVKVLVEQGKSPLRLTPAPGEEYPFHTSGIGKALVLDMDETELAELLPPPPWSKTAPNTITTMDRLWDHLRQARDRGYTLDDQDGNVGIRCVGSPIRDSRREIIGAISVTGTTIDCTDEAIPGIAEAVLRAGQGISRDLGFQGS